MNAKQAKKLRKLTRLYASNSAKSGTVFLRNGQAVVNPETQRGMYRQLCRETENGAVINS